MQAFSCTVMRREHSGSQHSLWIILSDQVVISGKTFHLSCLSNTSEVPDISAADISQTERHTPKKSKNLRWLIFCTQTPRFLTLPVVRAARSRHLCFSNAATAPGISWCEQSLALVISSDLLTDSALGDWFVKPHFKRILMGRVVAGFSSFAGISFARRTLWFWSLIAGVVIIPNAETPLMRISISGSWWNVELSRIPTLNFASSLRCKMHQNAVKPFPSRWLYNEFLCS